MLKFLSRIYAIIIIFCIGVNTVCIASSNDVSNQSYGDEIGVLIELGILKDSDTTPVTRAQFATYIARAMGFSESDLSNGIDNHKFSDVPVTHLANSSINILAALSIVSGDQEGNFFPDKTITYEQAVKIIVCALGYDVMAQSKGGYPFGYINVASEIGVTKGTTEKIGDEGSQGLIAKLIYNALEIDLLKQTFSKDGVKVYPQEGKTLLSERLKVIKSNGQLTATYDTGLYGKTTSNKDKVEIGGSVYNTGKTNAKEL